MNKCYKALIVRDCIDDNTQYLGLKSTDHMAAYSELTEYIKDNNLESDLVICLILEVSDTIECNIPVIKDNVKALRLLALDKNIREKEYAEYERLRDKFEGTETVYLY